MYLRNGKYAGSIIGDSAVICDEIIDTTKTVLTKSLSTKSTSTKTVPTKCTSTNFDISLAFLLTTALLIVVSIYSNLIKSRAKQKHLLPYRDTSKLKEIDISNIL